MNSSIILLVITLLVCVNASEKQEKDENRIKPAQDYSQVALEVRQLLFDSRSAVVATQNSNPGFLGYPEVDVQLIIDGPNGVSTGIPYFYVSKKDVTLIDLDFNHKGSVLMSRATIGGSCDDLPLLAKDPDCFRAELTGEKVEVKRGSTEYNSAYAQFTQKFPAIADLDQDGYAMGKINIKAVFIRAADGSADELPLTEYFKATPAAPF